MKKKLKLTEEEVRHVAKLAKLELTPVEVKKFQKQLSKILSYVDQLKKIPTQKVEPTGQVTCLINVFREDLSGFSLTAQEALANAPAKKNQFLKIKPLFEK